MPANRQAARAVAAAEAVRLKAAAEVEAMKHRLEMALEKEQSAREQQEQAHTVVVQVLDQQPRLFVQMAQLFYLLAVVEAHLLLVVVCKAHYVHKVQDQVAQVHPHRVL